MSTLSKVFVVLNTLLAFCFMMATLTLYAKKVDWVEQTKQSVEKRNELKTSLDNKIAEYEKLETDTTRQITDLKKDQKVKKTKIDNLEDVKQRLTKLTDRLMNELSQIKTNITALKGQVEEKDKRNKKLEDDLRRAVDERNKAQKEMEFNRTQAIEVTAELKESEEELLDLSKQNRSLITQLMEKDIIIQKVGQKVDLKLLMAGTGPVRRITARVLRVDDVVEIVILNVGEKDEVKAGMEFIISRGADYVGKVRVRNVYRDMCSATFIRPLMKKAPQVSDMAQTN